MGLNDWPLADREFLDGNVGGISERLEAVGDHARLAALRLLEHAFYGPRPEVLAAIDAREEQVAHPLDDVADQGPAQLDEDLQ